jgi:hypothetical protein
MAKDFYISSISLKPILSPHDTREGIPAGYKVTVH